MFPVLMISCEDEGLPCEETAVVRSFPVDVGGGGGEVVPHGFIPQCHVPGDDGQTAAGKRLYLGSAGGRRHT
jgi:hypothetical protein